MGGLAPLLARKDALSLLGKQPTLFQNSVDRTMEPKLALLKRYLERGADSCDAASELLRKRPRFFGSSFAVLGRVAFLASCERDDATLLARAKGGMMATRAAFFAKHPEYAAFLRRQLEDHPDQDRALSRLGAPDEAEDHEQLERRHGDLLKANVQEQLAAEKARLPDPTTTVILRHPPKQPPT